MLATRVPTPKLALRRGASAGLGAKATAPRSSRVRSVLAVLRLAVCCWPWLYGPPVSWPPEFWPGWWFC